MVFEGSILLAPRQALEFRTRASAGKCNLWNVHYLALPRASANSAEEDGSKDLLREITSFGRHKNNRLLSRYDNLGGGHQFPSASEINGIVKRHFSIGH